jgi:hypothetical protein
MIALREDTELPSVRGTFEGTTDAGPGSTLTAALRARVR